MVVTEEERDVDSMKCGLKVQTWKVWCVGGNGRVTNSDCAEYIGWVGDPRDRERIEEPDEHLRSKEMVWRKMSWNFKVVVSVKCHL